MGCEILTYGAACGGVFNQSGLCLDEAQLISHPCCFFLLLLLFDLFPRSILQQLLVSITFPNFMEAGESQQSHLADCCFFAGSF